MPIGRSDYEDRKEDRITSLAEKAVKAKKESDRRLFHIYNFYEA